MRLKSSLFHAATISIIDCKQNKLDVHSVSQQKSKITTISMNISPDLFKFTNVMIKTVRSIAPKSKIERSNVYIYNKCHGLPRSKIL